jgi:hypothetical protein
MYFSFNKEEIYRNFPIFQAEVDCIIDFFSLDLVKDIEFNKALYATNEEIYKRLFEFVFSGQVKAGNILPYSKSKPMIIHIPAKDLYTTDNVEEIIQSGIIKLSENYKKMKINTIAIQETKYINKEIISKYTENLDFPEIIFFESIQS